MTFHRFNMLYSHQCSINAMIIEKIIPPSRVDYYCGAMPPWTETCPCLEIHLQMMIKLTQPLSELNMSYTIRTEAILSTFMVIKYEQISDDWWTVNLIPSYPLDRRSSVLIVNHYIQLIMFILKYTGMLKYFNKCNTLNV